MEIISKNYKIVVTSLVSIALILIALLAFDKLAYGVYLYRDMYDIKRYLGEYPYSLNAVGDIPVHMITLFSSALFIVMFYLFNHKYRKVTLVSIASFATTMSLLTVYTLFSAMSESSYHSLALGFYTTLLSSILLGFTTFIIYKEEE